MASLRLALGVVILTMCIGAAVSDSGKLHYRTVLYWYLITLYYSELNIYISNIL